MRLCLEANVFLGVLTGLFATSFWWFELNIRTYCLGDWNAIPRSVHHRRLVVDIFEVILAAFWGFSCLAPICGWRTTMKLSLVYFCIAGALFDSLDRLLLYIFECYANNWKSYIGNAIFLVTTISVYYKFARHCKNTNGLQDHVGILTVKLSLQFTFGLVWALIFNHVILQIYYSANTTEQTILACVLVLLVGIPKVMLGKIIADVTGVYKPGDGITFVLAYITTTTLVTRLAQARIESFNYFIIISFVHGFLNVIEKLSLPLKEKLFRRICKRGDNAEARTLNSTLFLANQTLISVITETTSVIFSSAAAYVLLYYYKTDESTGLRYDGYILFREMATRTGIAVSIEYVFNVIAVGIHSFLYGVPITEMWRSKWKFIAVLHVIQIVFIIIAFSRYVDDILLRDYYSKANSTCFGFFRRI